jgi:ubiquinone/menaquinone biosynthesis C-methylase UbiE
MFMPLPITPSSLEQARTFYDRISHSYDLLADASERAIRDVGIQALQVSKNERVLELGFGTGHGLVGLSNLVGTHGRICGAEVSTGMMEVARRRIESAGRANVSLVVADARVLCFDAEAFDAVFMSFTLELFDSQIPRVLAEVRRVLRAKGRLGVVAMANAEENSAMTDLYQWMHRHWPHVVDCQPIDVVGVLRFAGFKTQAHHSATVWGLPVIAAVGVKE